MLVNYTTKELDLLARLMRAEAVGEGDLGMLMVGNVIVNRTIANCLTFKNNRTLTDTIYQSPGGFSGINSNLFFSSATTKEKELIKKFEQKKKSPKKTFTERKEMYLKQTDRNYKDGDRN